MAAIQNTQVITLKISEDAVGQRVDNFLISRYRAVPKSRIYKALRKGEVRVNRGRIKPTYRLQLHDLIRIPPLVVPERQSIRPPESLVKLIEDAVLYEDEGLMVLSKPPGISVHGGTGVAIGLTKVIEFLRPDAPRVDLIHRLDRDTSGVLMIAKTRHALNEWQEAFRSRQVLKEYFLLVSGEWQDAQGAREVELPLKKNQLQGGERMVRVDPTGKPARSVFRLVRQYAGCCLLVGTLSTGRTHQLRVHARSIGHPIIGDEKYGEQMVNKHFRQKGLKRIFLHSAVLAREVCYDGRFNGLCAPLSDDLSKVLAILD